VSVLCPSCQAEQPDPPGRFCEACGVALPRLAASNTAQEKARAAEPLQVRCPECGMPAMARKCRACGARVSWPDDVTPPDEDPRGGWARRR